MFSRGLDFVALTTWEKCERRVMRTKGQPGPKLPPSDASYTPPLVLIYDLRTSGHSITWWLDVYFQLTLGRLTAGCYLWGSGAELEMERTICALDQSWHSCISSIDGRGMINEVFR